MKKYMIFFVVPILFGVALVLPVFSQDSASAIDHSGHIGAVSMNQPSRAIALPIT